ncbi:hypothetical protein D9M73_235190 [compost metagenome]
MVTVNGLPLEVDFRQKPIVMITYDIAPNKENYNRVDVEYVDGKWKARDYSELRIHDGFKEYEVKKVIKDYLFYVKKIVAANK